MKSKNIDAETGYNARVQVVDPKIVYVEMLDRALFDRIDIPCTELDDPVRGRMLGKYAGQPRDLDCAVFFLFRAEAASGV
ncbi:MAG: hypothetical protein IKE60_23225 [Reyranella sp.]|jgi:hypothetical protein|uniref:hypothetical protein n=1 Tax=Reyranella sp. TaxID=1929291 RepID=UPI0025EA9C50|nr:hypothetical protein [Reyranella sp.]MBR2817592.1 hypothetical protein [Reyranella sp.]